MEATVDPVALAAPMPRDARGNEDTVKALYDLAIRQHDQLEKAYDTLNTRVGVVFGFSAFLSAAFFKVIEFLPSKNHQMAACFLLASVVVSLAWQCKQAFSVATLRALPSARNLARDFTHLDSHALRLQLISNLTDDYTKNLPLHTAKADRLQKAITLVFVQTALSLMVLGWASIEKLGSAWSQLLNLFTP